MPSTLRSAALAAGLATAVMAGQPKNCPVSQNTPLSCHNTTAVQDTCCFNTPGGLLLQTQFWDAQPATGPADSWTVHGLWPDNCDGTYQQFCDKSREYTNISAIVKAGNPQLLDFMNKYWKDMNGDDEQFWEHEWGKHGTCISSFDTNCYTDYQPQEEVVDFFNKTVELFQSLPTYKWLSDAGITPDSSKTYALTDILKALGKNRDGVEPYVGCQDGALDEVWYFYNTQGNAQNGVYKPVPPSGATTKCPDTGIKYLPKNGSGGGGSPTTTSSGGSPATTTSSQPTGTGSGGDGSSFQGSGFLNVDDGSGANGCLISNGKWYVGGTCATFKAAASGNGFTLSSHKGPCALAGGAISCASGNKAAVFQAQGGKLLNGQDSTWYADAVPNGNTQSGVQQGEGKQSITITWGSASGN